MGSLPAGGAEAIASGPVAGNAVSRSSTLVRRQRPVPHVGFAANRLGRKHSPPSNVKMAFKSRRWTIPQTGYSTVPSPRRQRIHPPADCPPRWRNWPRSIGKSAGSVQTTAAGSSTSTQPPWSPMRRPRNPAFQNLLGWLKERTRPLEPRSSSSRQIVRGTGTGWEWPPATAGCAGCSRVRPDEIVHRVAGNQGKATAPLANSAGAVLRSPRWPAGTSGRGCHSVTVSRPPRSASDCRWCAADVRRGSMACPGCGRRRQWSQRYFLRAAGGRRGRRVQSWHSPSGGSVSVGRCPLR